MDTQAATGGAQDASETLLCSRREWWCQNRQGNIRKAAGVGRGWKKGARGVKKTMAINEKMHTIFFKFN